MTRVIAFNGSPRKNWNTSILLTKALAGAASKGADTKLINLYDLNYDGCISCFACKTIGGKNYSKCAINDDLTPILEEIEQADDQLKSICQIEHTRHRSPFNFMSNLLTALVAYVLRPRKPSVKFDLHAGNSIALISN